MSKLYMMMGAPGSGKSTWCKANLPKDAVYISRDEIRFAMLKNNEDYFSKENQVYAEFVKQINEALKQEKDVYADQTSLNRGARAKLINALDIRPDEVNVIYIKRPLEQILEFNAKRTGRALVPEKAVINMYNSIQLPTWHERIKFLITIENGKTIIKDLEKEDRWLYEASL